MLSSQFTNQSATTVIKSERTVKQVFEYLVQQSPFDQLDETLLHEIAQNSHLIYLAQENQDELLQTHRHCLYLIQSGQFAIKDNPEPIKHLSEGDYFGFSVLLDDIEYGLKVIVDSPGIVICIKQDYFKQCLNVSSFSQFFTALQNDVLHNQAVSDSNSRWLYKPLFEVVYEKPLSASPFDSIQDTAMLMTKNRKSSVMVMQDKQLVGIVTDRDFRTRVISKGVDPRLPVSTIMTRDPVFLTKNKTVFDAICAMNEFGIHHLPIIDARTNMPYGMVTNTDISKQHRASVMFVISDLSKANNLDELIKASKQVPQYIASTAKRAGDFDIAGKVLAQASDIMTRKLLTFYEQAHGAAPIAYAWLVFGSQAREDQNMGSDQDNALLLAEETTDSQSAYFASMSEYVCKGLGKCGIKLCDGNIMASNPKLRMSLDSAMTESKQWVKSPTKEAILQFNIFLDTRVIAGDKSLFISLQMFRTKLFQHSMFLAALARNANEVSVPLSMFQKFVYAKHSKYGDSIDIKHSAVSIINNIVRLYALASEISVAGTIARLNNLPSDSGLSPKDRRNLKDIWLFLNRLRWRHQLNNNVDDNFVRIGQLSSIEKHQLKAAFQAIHKAQQALVLKFSGGIG